jgi:hypothetical protein
MLNLAPRAHLPAVQFSRRAYMGCGGWDLAQAPKTTVASLDEDRLPTRAATRPSSSRPRRTVMGCGGGGYAPDFMRESEDEDGPVVTLEPGLSGARLPKVVMGCGTEACEECAAAGMGCTKCKRIRKHAMMNQELEGANRLGQASGLPDTSVLVVSGLAVAGLFYLVTR